MATTRRVVTGRNARGQSVVLSDGVPPPADFAGQTVVWTTDATPARTLTPQVADGMVGKLPPPPQGSRLLLFEVPPEDPSLSREEVQNFMADIFARLGVPDAQVDTSRHPRMHRTHTVDYVILLSGEITLILDEGEVSLNPFDVVIQQGTNHAWANRGRAPALLAVVLTNGADV